MRSAIRIALVSAASLALTLGSSIAALADSGTLKDKRNDVIVGGTVGGDRSQEVRSAAYRRDVTSVKVSHGSKNLSIKINFANLQRLDAPTDSAIANSMDISIQFVRKSKFNLGSGLDPTLEYRDSFGAAGARPEGGRMFEGGIRYGGEFDQVCGVSQGDEPGDQPSYGLPQFKVEAKYGKGGYYKVQMPRACIRNESKIKAKVSVGGYTDGVSYGEVVSSKKFKTADWTEWLLKD